MIPWAALLAVAAAPASAQLISGANAFPTELEDDGKFVALAGTEFATLTQGNLSFSVQVPMTDPGSNHACVSADLSGRCVFTGIYGAQTGWESYDISAYISAETTVRFRVTNLYGGSDEWFKVDTLTVEGTCD